MIYNEKQNILSMLHRFQQKSGQNYISKDDLIFTANYFELNYGIVYGVATYYKMFSLIPRGKYMIRLCKSPVCNMLGSIPLLDFLLNELKINKGSTTGNGLFTVETVECLGQCNKAPCMLVNKNLYGELTPQKIDEIIVHYEKTLLLKT